MLRNSSLNDCCLIELSVSSDNLRYKTAGYYTKHVISTTKISNCRYNDLRNSNLFYNIHHW